MSKQTWIIYKSEPDQDHDWESRQLLPDGGLTDILKEEWSYSPDYAVSPGDRPRQFADITDTDIGTSSLHSAESSWLVTRVSKYSSPDDEVEIVVCYCKYEPIEPEWEQIPVGKPLTELLPAP